MKNQDELFHFVEYSSEAAERIGYSDYSYWKSVFQNFLKKKSAVVMAFVFFAVVIFSFVALSIGKYNYAELKTSSALAFIRPNGEYWFGTDNLGRDYWCQVWYAAQVSIRLALVVAVGDELLVPFLHALQDGLQGKLLGHFFLRRFYGAVQLAAVLAAGEGDRGPARPQCQGGFFRRHPQLDGDFPYTGGKAQLRLQLFGGLLGLFAQVPQAPGHPQGPAVPEQAADFA